MATMKNKSVSFNVEKDADKHMFDFCDKIPNFSLYIKGLVWKDLQARQQMQKPPHQSGTA